MESKNAVKAFAALAHDTRLDVFRLLVRQGPSGLRAGEISARLGVPPSTLSAHLSRLESAGLLRSWRDARNVIYAPHVEGVRLLLTFLTEDCCQGHPEMCGTQFATPFSCG
ncbi:MAG: helix-turn-helix transcriptional regulator [Hyphomicrobiales bacterium]|nr:helix-turn-helix transcriptional regulator [Hyphomicrobiales bacterium]